MKKGLANMQLGKNGLSSGFIDCLKNTFKERESIKIRILKSAGHDKEKIKKMAEEIIENLGKKYTYKIIGFSIFIKKWRRAIR